MTETVKQLNYPRFFHNFQRFERGELPLSDVERLSMEERAAHFTLLQVVRHMLMRLHFPTPGEFYRGDWRPYAAHVDSRAPAGGDLPPMMRDKALSCL